ncbi:serine/threonine-protein phosphatase [Streptomyces sp. KK5PA1]|uniref:Serine/threonine-protein phosphatase n=1 Tax=Actinacidiphila acididurans TaxID=2784346 RepID=A0ABS2TZD5_9ACTN|nr:PP2C family protein-serine/threonine phosphatase [Actinacidiphila acididurans]MBM9508693.1 serine/threonine-protein phosphatase [Actinacidiphila acididurans]
MLLLSGNGSLLEASSSARTLLGNLPAGEPDALGDVAPWLARAHRDMVVAGSRPDTDVRGAVGDRSVRARASARTDGSVVWWLLDDTEQRLAEQALRVERERTAFLAEASSKLLASLNVERCMDVTAQEAVRRLADAAVVIGPRSGHRMRFVSCVRDGRPVAGTTGAGPDTLPGLAEALQGFPPVPSRWIDPTSAPDWLVPEGFGPVGSLVVTPLPGHGVPAGALVLLRHGDREVFDEAEEVFARLFAARAGAAVSAARLYAEQASITETLMRELLPPTLKQHGGIEFAGGYRPAGERDRVGGDFYDVHPDAGPDGETLAVLGDVCGKGLEAAVLTGKIRNTLHALLPLAGDHQRLLRLLNQALLTSPHSRFATLVLASARRLGDTVVLRVSSAGHPVPLVIRSDGRVEQARTRGTLIGVLPEVTTTTDTVTLDRGESLVLFSDGIVEARGGPLGNALFGEDRLRAALSACVGMPAEAIVEHVQMLTSQWVGGRRHDDMAVVVVSVPHGARLSMVGGTGRGRYTA